MTQLIGDTRHSVNYRALFVLTECHTAFLVNGSKLLGTIPAHAGHDYPKGAVGISHRD